MEKANISVTKKNLKFTQNELQLFAHICRYLIQETDRSHGQY